MAGIVNILLSTYNGMRFLEQQLESLLAQSYPYITITVRDDGSTDGTYERLLEYARRHSNFVVLRGENLGVVRSYFKLLYEATEECDFYAFCDQDDVWLPNKIRDAVDAMLSHDTTEPLMYFSRIEYVGSDLRHIDYSKIFRRVGFTNALVENVATGCTVVLNRTARNLICEKIPCGIRVHDWWFYLVVSGLGRLIYDERPNIRYRLHEDNVVGYPVTWEKRARRWLANRWHANKNVFRASDHAKEFYRCYGDRLQPQDLKSLQDFISAKERIGSRIKYAFRMDVWSQALWGTLLLRLRIILGRY